MVRAFSRAPSGLIGGLALLLVVGVAILAPALLSGAAEKLDVSAASLGPSRAHLLGTDSLGRDLLARLLVASRLSLGVAVLGQVIAFLIGVPLGAATALLRPRGRSVATRGIDTMIAFPALIVTIYLVILLRPRLGLAGLAIALATPGLFQIARIVSALSMTMAGRDYVLAARVVGVRPHRLVLRYIIPNAAETLITTFSIGIGVLILALSGLSFLGLGVQAPQFDWGTMLTQGVNAFYLNPAAAFGPLVFLAGSALSFSLVGEALARASNPLTWARSPSRVETAKARVLEDPSFTASLAAADGSAQEAMSLDRATLQARHLTVQFPTDDGVVTVVSDVSFDVAPGEVLGVVGESGSGKTMTALAIAGLVPFPGRVSGKVALLGEELQRLSYEELERLLGTELAMVFQDPTASLNPALTVGRQLAESARRHRGLSRRAAVRLAIARLKEVNLPSADRLIRRRPHELSGGMRQRVMIAMGLMNEPALIICDEPTTALDVTIQAQVMDLLGKINLERRTSIILVSHNLALIGQNCHRVLVMYAGRVVEDLPADRLLVDAQHPYTLALLEAVPDLGRRRGQLFRSIRGQPPDLAALPRGCPFHPRCPLAQDRCLTQLPPLTTFAENRRVACWVASERLGLQ